MFGFPFNILNSCPGEQILQDWRFSLIWIAWGGGKEVSSTVWEVLTMLLSDAVLGVDWSFKIVKCLLAHMEVLLAADALISTGLASLGYTYVNIGKLVKNLDFPCF